MLWKCKKSLKNKKNFGKIRLLFLWKLIYNFIMIWKGVAFFMEQRVKCCVIPGKFMDLECGMK